jgi:hypothetical protein
MMQVKRTVTEKKDKKDKKVKELNKKNKRGRRRTFSEKAADFFVGN